MVNCTGILYKVGALIVRIGSWARLYTIIKNRNPHKGVGNYFGPDITDDIRDYKQYPEAVPPQPVGEGGGGAQNGPEEVWALGVEAVRVSRSRV